MEEHTFIPYKKALSIIENHCENFKVTTRNLEECIGAYLAEDLIADRDFPPFDRVTMDGIAIAYTSFENGQREFQIAATAGAGTPQKTLINPQHCIEIMTGAIMPIGVDTVIRYEDLSISEGTATINLNQLVPKQNVHFKGIDISKGSCIVPKGKRISSAEINIAASVGKAVLKVLQMPKIVVFSTGDELVPIAETPELHQIRRSNVYGIQATLKEWGLEADLQHLPDNKTAMTAAISKMLEVYDVFIFTGGVSKGKFDFLPEVLTSLSVKKHFHKIQQRPGKPFWFGTTTNNKPVFALPGNPVSSFVCTYVYIRYWLYKSLDIEPKQWYVTLESDIHFKPELIYFLEASLTYGTDGKLIASALKGNGSGDFANLVKADGFLVLPQDKSSFLEGEVYPFIPYRSSF